MYFRRSTSRKGIDMEYEEMLKKAVKNLPVRTETRFEIPAASVQTGKRQTVLRNFAKIDKTIRRTPQELAKYLFKELAVPGEVRGAELVLQAEVSSSLVNQRIKEYVRDFVIC